MKHESINQMAPTIFSEQLSNVFDLFQQWNDCERAVMLVAVLKKIPFPITKLLQSVIDSTLQQAQCKEQAKVLERNANCPKYINSLSETYKSIKYNEAQLTTDSIFFESDRSIDNIDKYYDKKEEILHDILKMMPVLTVGNKEAKLAYLEFIPMSVSDVTRRIVSSTLVQQIFCYVLIHPAFSTDDRGSVIKYMKVLETHINTNEPNFFIYRNGSSPTSEPTNPSTPSNWQAIAPPSSKSTETIPSLRGSSHHLTRGFNDDIDFRMQPAPLSSSQRFSESASDDHHISFQRNGKIVNDVDDTNKFNTQLGFLTLPGVTKHVISPGLSEHNIIKTSRSNSLTTISQMTRTSLLNTNEKQRSFSLSGISTLNFGGSDMLDESKPICQSPQHHHIGMSNIGQWLKSLRLHKYVFLFSQRTYEQMLDITEEHLQSVTAGARHKLVNCIQKLKERYGYLCQVEKDLLCGQISIGEALVELPNIVLTPMKPIEPFNKQDVASQFLKVLDLISTKMTAKHIVPQDEDSVNKLVYILDKAVHNEAFVAHTNILKEHRYNMHRIKDQFPSKSHYSKNNAASSNNIHRQRAPLKLKDYLPDRSPSFSGIFQPHNLLPPLPFSTVIKCDSLYGKEQRISDLFKIAKLPSIPIQNGIMMGSAESLSSGYHSDGYQIGMSNIFKWLKSLRLHKYNWVFEGVSYDKMFTFTEDYLKSLGITQGASHKLAICIEKLKTRSETMKQIETNLSQNRMHVAEAIREMMTMVLSPMKPMQSNSDTDVGYQFWKVLNSVFNLIASNFYDEQTVQSFQQLVESSINSEAFIEYICQLRDMRMKLARVGRRMIR